jgi:hypothetical protein
VDGDGFARARRDLTDGLLEALVALWVSLSAWHRENVAEFLAEAIPLVEAAQRTLADLVAVKVADNATEALGRPVRAPLLADDDVTDLRNGVDAADVYTRPFVDVWTGLRDGLELDEAVDRGRVRLEGIAEFDMQQAHAEATDKAQRALAKRDRPTWWERTLQGDENCALCLAASTVVYTVGELNPIHPGCDCGVEEHWDKPPKALHPDRLQQAYEAIGVDSTSGDVLRGVIVKHDELGNVLVTPRQKAPERIGTPRSLGFDSLGRDELEHQIGVLEGLKKSEWRDEQLARYRARLASL